MTDNRDMQHGRGLPDSPLGALLYLLKHYGGACAQKSDVKSEVGDACWSLDELCCVMVYSYIPTYVALQGE
jgi:hypothetical protein